MVALNPAYFAQEETPAFGGGLGHDWRNRLVSRLYGDGTRIDIRYDGNGDRFSKSITEPLGIPQFTYYLVDRNNLTGYAQVVEEIAQGGAVQVVYAYGLDLISQDSFDGSLWTQSYCLRWE